MTKTIAEIQKQLQNRTLTCRALIDQYVNRIQKLEPKLHAFLSVSEAEARAQADRFDVAFAKGENLPPLAGVPIAIKDNMCLTGAVTTCASKMLKNFIAPYDATVIARLKSAGCIILGKTNMDEFAMGSSTENSAFGPTKNPWHCEHVPGGSSGGSAAAVAANEVPIALGSDTGGSIRQPAAYCGVVGFKPTYGRVSRYGLIAFASSLDQIGPMAYHIEDCASILNIICGHDVLDSTSSQEPVPNFKKALKADVKNLTIGLPKELFGPEIEPAIKEAVLRAVEQLKKQGATITEITMPSFPYAIATYYILASAEASSNLARFDGVRYTHRAAQTENIREMYNKTRGEGFGPEVKRRIILGTYVLSAGYYDAYYLKAQKARTCFKEDFHRAFQNVDVIITPTAPTTAFKINERTDDPLKMYAADVATIPVSLAGLPAVSIPCGFSQGMPIGMQLIGKPFDEAALIQAAYTYQSITDHHKQQPPLTKESE